MRVLARLLATVVLLLPTIAQARPHHWYTDKTNLAIILGAAAADLYATKQIANCRGRNDIIHCPDGGYGPFHGREGVRGGITILAAGLTIYGREHWRHGWRDEALNAAPVALWSGWNLAVGRSDQTTPTFPREDLSRARVRLASPPRR